MSVLKSMTRLESRYCPVCGPEMGKKQIFPPTFKEEDFNRKTFSARRVPDRRHFRIVECQGCQIAYSDPACDPSELNHLYEMGTVNYHEFEDQIFSSYEPVLNRGL